MTVVIDIGCATYNGDSSIERLIRRFEPDVLYGFDPALTSDVSPYAVVGTRIELSATAAYVYEGEIGFNYDRTRSAIDIESKVKVPCFDLAEFVLSLGTDGIVLKIDAEGAEYALLEHLIATGADRKL